MCMVGVTGTNGKTTTTYMLKRIFESTGKKVGLIGTIHNMIGDKVLHTERTTPESPDFQELLAEMAADGVDIVVMEVSSHSLSLKRVYGVEFDVSVFTNLTQDHLDFHGTFENYAAAKHILSEHSKCMAANVDDGYGEYMLQNTKAKTLSYGIDNGEMRASDLELTERNAAFMLKYKNSVVRMEVGISGKFTVYNTMSAAAVCVLLGIDLKTVRDALKGMTGVAGRFESLDTKTLPATVILDYAHTPDSLENVLKTARGFAKGRVVCIVGCGGNRDAKKRPIMGEIAGKNADFTVVTSDNPRFEDPMAIIEDILPGIQRTGAEYTVIENRREAILYSLKNCKKDDIIILAGKGHEDYQEICGVKHHFDEKEVVAELLEELGY